MALAVLASTHVATPYSLPKGGSPTDVLVVSVITIAFVLVVAAAAAIGRPGRDTGNRRI